VAAELGGTRMTPGRYFTHQYQRDSTDRAVAGEEDTRRPALCRITRIDKDRVFYQADVRGGRSGDSIVADGWMFSNITFGAWADEEGQHEDVSRAGVVPPQGNHEQTRNQDVPQSL